MKTTEVKLVLATWDQVEPGDQVWYNDMLHEVDDGPFDPDESTALLASNGWQRWTGRAVGTYHYYDSTDMFGKLHERVPVVVP